ncbi:MAG: amino acid ABC transporter ATP-binding protein [Ruminococcaceae bacterium]|nr:amino acid ABC transporter ATP-binding protein [Oscillospiraceae bacterium]
MSIIEVKNIKKSFGSSKILKGIDFSMETGDVLAIIGSSGSGKTTLLRCINFLETPDEGQIYLNGNLIYDAVADKDIPETTKRQKRLHFGLVFQSFNLFPQYTAFENICLAPKLHAEERPDFKEKKPEIFAEIEKNADYLLERVGLTDKKNLYPCQLSGGQQQRVAIARALAMKPDILCFDEPTSALDPELTGEVLRVLRQLSDEDTTMIIVTHEMAFAREIADKIIFMDEGVVAAEGSPDEIFSSHSNARLESFVRSIEK